MSQQLRLAILGLHHWYLAYAIGDALLRIHNVELKTVAHSDAHHARDFAARYRVPVSTTS
jgi:predicted dehydrogenase